MRTFLTASASAALILGLGAGTASVPAPAHAFIGVGISVGFAPPPLPVYVQPPMPGYGYMWTPGYWGWASGPGDYYWVPGTWVEPPSVGLLWTPGYWGWNDGAYVFNDGYWGPTIGFYGGINYGFGYWGNGYGGGYWNGNNFYYNRTVNNFGGANIVNAYSHNFPYRMSARNASYNGGAGGVRAAPTGREAAAASAAHVGPTSDQLRNRNAAMADPSLRASVNHGNPPIAATSRAGEFKGAGAVAATRGANWTRPAVAGAAAGLAAHAAISHAAASHLATTRTARSVSGAAKGYRGGHVGTARSYHARTSYAHATHGAASRGYAPSVTHGFYGHGVVRSFGSSRSAGGGSMRGFGGGSMARAPAMHAAAPRGGGGGAGRRPH
jgi:hypothetical protein